MRTPTSPVVSACRRTWPYEIANCWAPSAAESPRNPRTSRAVSRHEDDEPGEEAGHDELGADHAGAKADYRLDQPTHPEDAPRERVLTQPAHGPCEQARLRPRRQAEVHDDERHDVDGDPVPRKERREARLDRQRDGDAQPDPEGPHSVPSAGSTGSGGESTTSTSESREKSTAGSTSIARYSPAPRSADLTRPMANPRG